MLAEDVYEHKKAQEYNEDEINGDDGVGDLERRQINIDGLSGQASEAIVNGFQSQSNPEQLQKLKEILSLEMNNKDRFAEIYSQMNPEQVKKIRELVLRIGQQTGSEELIKFGQCKSPRFNEKGVQVLIGLGEALYERLNTDTTGVQVNRTGFANPGDQSEVFNQMKASISNQQNFIRRLVNMIEVQLSKAPQIDDAEFTELKEITQQIKTLSSKVQTQLQEANDVSQLTQMGDELLQINTLSTKLQQKVTAELLEDRMNEYVNSMSNTNQATESSGNSVNLQARDTATTETQAPQVVGDVERLLGGVQWFFEKLRREREEQLREQGIRPFVSKYAAQAVRQVQEQYPQVAGTLQYVQQQYPQVNNALQAVQQEYPEVTNAIQQAVQPQNPEPTNTNTIQEQTPELTTTQNADGSLTLQAADQLPQETSNTVETNLTPEGTNTAAASS